MQKKFVEEKVVKKISRKRYFKEVEQEVQKAGPSKAVKKPKSWALQTLVDEVSGGTDSDYGNVIHRLPLLQLQQKFKELKSR